MADLHTADLASFLEGALRAHGVDFARDGDRVRLAGTDMHLSGAIVSEQTFETHTSVQLDVRFEIGPGRTIIESCAGIGVSPEEARDNAKQAFAANALHVLLATFARAATDQITEEAWESGGRPFRAVLGNVTGRGDPPEGRAPVGWFSEVETAVREAALAPRTHWLRVYVARTASDDHVTEVLLDNDEWPELAARIAAYPWPPTDGFYSVRIFLVLDGGFDTSRAVAALHRLADEADVDVADALVAQGADLAHAEKLVDLVPLAFGRRVLDHLGVRTSPVAVRRTGDEDRRFQLVEDPVFADAAELARAVHAQGGASEAISKSVAMRSAELVAVNAALGGGAEPTGIVLSPPQFQGWIRFAP